MLIFWKRGADNAGCERISERLSEGMRFTTSGESLDKAVPGNPSWEAGETPQLEASVVLAGATVREWADLGGSSELIGALVQWSEDDPDAAVAWLAQIPAGVRETAQRELAGALMSRRPLEAITLLSALPQSGLNAQMLRQAAMEYAMVNPEEARRWALDQPDEQTRALLLGAALCVQASDQPAEAAKGLNDLPGGFDQEVVWIEVIERWAQVNAIEAAAFVADVSGPVSIPAVENLMVAWALRDPDGSYRWALERADFWVREAAIAAWTRATSQHAALRDAMGLGGD